MARIIECQVKDEYVKGAGVVIGGASSHDDVSLKLIFSPMWAGLAKQLTWLNARGENPIIQLLTTDLAVDSNTYVVPIPFEAKEYAGNPTMSVRGNTVDDHEISVTINSATWEASALGGEDGIFKFVYNGGWTYQDASVTLTTYGLTLTGTAKNNDAITVVRATVSSVSSVTATATAFHEEFVATITQTAEFIVLESVYDETAQSSQDVTASQAAQLQAEIDDIKDDILDARAAATEAAASATQASNSATSASGYATAASGSATSASTSATQAGISSVSANNAKTAAQAAQTAAETAKTNAEAAQTAAESARDKILNMSASASSLPEGSSPTVTKTEVGGVVNLAFGIPKGDTGDDGDSATITVGTVTTVEPNVPASVVNVGTETAAIFNFNIPKGVKGDAGIGAGDMLASDYDIGNVVRNAGGIPNYVALNGGKIDHIQVGGVEQEIVNKTVNLEPFPHIVATISEHKATFTGANIVVNSHKVTFG